MKRWLAILRHDLLKHALWCARDLEATGAPTRGDIDRLAAQLLALPGSDGTPSTVSQRFAELAQSVPIPPHSEADWAAASAEFLAALERAEQGVAALVASSDTMPTPERLSAALAEVLALDPALRTLGRRLHIVEE